MRLRTARTYTSAGGHHIRDFLAAGFIDHMHFAVVPMLLGRGVRLWDGLEGLERNYRIEATSPPSGVTHLTFTHAAYEPASVENTGTRSQQGDDFAF